VYRLAVSNSEVYYTTVSPSVGTRTDIRCKMNETRFQTLYHAQIKLSVYLGKDIGPVPNYSEMSGRVIVNNSSDES
jgi:hypothetical protein